MQLSKLTRFAFDISAIVSDVDMGRKTNWAEKPKSGPGRKARKQPAPAFPGLGSLPGQSSGISKNKRKKDFQNKKKVRTFGDAGLKPGQPFQKGNPRKNVSGKQVKLNWVTNYCNLSGSGHIE